jgi:hypothetical protein
MGKPPQQRPDGLMNCFYCLSINLVVDFGRRVFSFLFGNFPKFSLGKAGERSKEAVT